MNKDKYIGIFISSKTLPELTYRISTSKGWCTRHINEEFIRWYNCKCYGFVWSKVIKLSELQDFVNQYQANTKQQCFIKKNLEKLI